MGLREGGRKRREPRLGLWGSKRNIMLRGSADRLHSSRPSCKLIQGVINTNPTKGAPGSRWRALSPCNQSPINLPSPCAQRPSHGWGPALGTPQPWSRPGWPALSPFPPWLPPFLCPGGPPLPQRSPARLLPLSLASAALSWGGCGVTGSPV